MDQMVTLNFLSLCNSCSDVGLKMKVILCQSDSRCPVKVSSLDFI